MQCIEKYILYIIAKLDFDGIISIKIHQSEQKGGLLNQLNHPLLEYILGKGVVLSGTSSRSLSSSKVARTNS